MSSTFGDKIKISVFGESHGGGIGVVIDGLPAGERIDLQRVNAQMARRAPGRDKTATPRKESDLPKIISGMLGDTLTGAPLCAMIENTNTRSTDYGNLLTTPRPGHSDYAAFVKYGGNNDIRGGGHFSGRLTAPIVFAGAVCRQILEKKGIKIAAHIQSIGGVCDDKFGPVNVDDDLVDRLSNSSFSLINPDVEQAMRDEVESARLALDSVGGVIECAVLGLPTGLGEPMFDGMENIIAKNIFAIPAVKGIEFGSGFEGTLKYGSENNDDFTVKDGKISTVTNNHGGILGGITSGMPLVFRVAVKPTPSIGTEQTSVNLDTKKEEALTVRGRHDPCIVPRAVPAVEAVAAITVLDLLL